MPIENIQETLVKAVQPYDIRWGDVFSKEDIVPSDEPKVVSPFDSFFNAAMDALEETNEISLIADRQQQDLATGKTSDILGVLLAQDKAYSSLNFTVQVTNKVIESYREIMRMQL